MRRVHSNIRAIAMIEYVVLIVIILGALYVAVPRIVRVFNGHWKTSGDSFGFGRQYQTARTAECAYAQLRTDYGVWYDNVCFTHKAALCGPRDKVCEDNARMQCGTDAQKAYCCENNNPSENGPTNCDP